MVLGLSWPPVSYYMSLKLVFSKDLVHFIEIIRSICEKLSGFPFVTGVGFLPMVPDTLFSYRSLLTATFPSPLRMSCLWQESAQL